jgi:excisionase family DNA binding protein
MIAKRPEIRGNEDLLTARQVARRLSFSTRTLYRLVKNGNFPQPVRYSRKLVRWRTVDIEAYLSRTA